MSGYETLAAIKLATNLSQFIETALKIYKSASNNPSGLADEFESIEDLTNTLHAHTTAVAQGVDGQLPQEHEQIVKIANQCRIIAEDLLRMVQKLRVGDGQLRSVALVGKAVRASWNRPKIQEMETLLDKYRRQLVSHIVFSCRSRLDGLSVEVKASALNTVEILRRSQTHNDDIKSGFKDVEARLNNIQQTIQLRPLSPVPSYNTMQLPGAPVVHPLSPGPRGVLEALSLPLHEAALRGESKLIHRTLQMNGIFIDAKDEDGQTALHLSVLADDMVFTKGLLAEGNLELNAIDNDRRTPLHYAARNNSTKMVVLLLQHGAQADILDIENKTPGDYADNNTSHIVWILKHGVSQEAKDEALLEFTKMGDAKAVEEMLRLGARVTAKAHAGNQALMYAATHGHSEITKAICESGNISIDDTNNAGQTALMLAAMNGHLEVAKTLLRESPSLELKDEQEGRTALFYALAHAHGDGDELVDSRWAIATAVLKAGADIEVEDKADLTPLAWFCRSGKFPAVRWLVQHGARVNGKLGVPRQQLTPLMEAASCQGDTEGACRIIQHLVDRGADMELHDNKNGHTALFEAVVSACVPQLKLLIGCGAHINTFSRLRQLPLTIAARRGYDEVVEILLQHGSYVHIRDYLNRAPINHASEFRRLRCVELLIEYGSPLSVQNEHLWTPLHEAAHRDDYNLMLLLLRQPGVELDLQTDEGETPLHKSCKLDNPRCAELLIKHGASVSLAKNQGWTPLDEASKHGLVRTINALIVAGADPNRMSSCFRTTTYTPLMHAAHHGKLEVCKVLVDNGAKVRLHNSDGETAYHIAKSHPRVQSFLGQCQADMNKTCVNGGENREPLHGPAE